MFFLTFYRPHVPSLTVVGGMDGLQPLCLWVLLPALLHNGDSGLNPVSSPLALNANDWDVCTPTSHPMPMGRDGDL